MSKITDQLQMKFDELNIVTAAAIADSNNSTEVSDTIENMLVNAYVVAAETIDDEIDEMHEIDVTRMYEVINKVIDGKTFSERVSEYYEQGDSEAIKRVAETELHRTFNQSIIDTAKKSDKNLTKTWVTMGDDRVREDHFYLEGVTIPLNDEFVTIGGYTAQAPSLFGVPQLDCGCRCTLDIKEK